MAKRDLLKRVAEMHDGHNFKFASAKRSLQEIRDYIDTPGASQDLIAFKDVTHNLDEFRNEDFAETFPELKKYIYGETRQDT